MKVQTLATEIIDAGDTASQRNMTKGRHDSAGTASLFLRRFSKLRARDKQKSPSGIYDIQKASFPLTLWRSNSLLLVYMQNLETRKHHVSNIILINNNN